MSKTKNRAQKQAEQSNHDHNQQQSGTEFSSDWDVEKYRREYESEEHWQLRKRFMDVHKDKFPEDKLVCLAQVFTNMEFMGCKYPSETMIMVGELSKEVAKEFRADRANRLKRTFVTASDAAEARAKGRRSTQQMNNVPGTSFQGNKNRKRFEDGGDDGYNTHQPLAKKATSSVDLFAGLKYGNFVISLHGDRNCLRLSAQRNNVQYAEKEVAAENGRKRVEIHLNNQLVASACEENLKASKAEAFRRTLSSLQELCYSIKNFIRYLMRKSGAYRGRGGYRGRGWYHDRNEYGTGGNYARGRRNRYMDYGFENYNHNPDYYNRGYNNPDYYDQSSYNPDYGYNFHSHEYSYQNGGHDGNQNPSRDTIKIEKTNNKVVCGVIKTQQEAPDDKKIDASNKGYKMMKMMGWSGGGLGSQKQGREDPVGYLLKNNRAGLGNDACKLDRKYFMQMLKNYVESDDIRELQFEPTFTKEERAMLHEIANKFNLKSTSHGQDEQRRLIINKKTITDTQILFEILIQKNPRFMDRYFIQVPQSKFSVFPDYTVPLTL